MMRKGFVKTVTLMLMFTPFLLAGCGSSSQRVEYYTFNPLTGLQAEANTPVTDQRLSIGIGPVEIPIMLDRPQIVTRSGPNKLNIDEFNRWAGRLDESFARVLAQNISLLLATDQVAVYPWQTDFKPLYRIALKINYFEGQWGKDVLLEAIWSVTGLQSQTTPGMQKTTINEPLSAEQNYEALVAAHSRAIARLSRDIAQEIQRLQAK
jgi:uncharacterized lipoprotein YmbA